MTVFATEGFRKSNLVKKELWPESAYNYELLELTLGAETELVVGSVLGQVTATGAYIVAVETAIDGSEVPAAVVVEEVTVPAATATKVLAMVRGPAILSKFGLALDASYDDDTKRGVAYAALEAKNILMNDSV